MYATTTINTGICGPHTKLVLANMTNRTPGGIAGTHLSKHALRCVRCAAQCHGVTLSDHALAFYQTNLLALQYHHLPFASNCVSNQAAAPKLALDCLKSDAAPLALDLCSARAWIQVQLSDPKERDMTSYIVRYYRMLRHSIAHT